MICLSTLLTSGERQRAMVPLLLEIKVEPWIAEDFGVLLLELLLEPGLAGVVLVPEVAQFLLAREHEFLGLKTGALGRLELGEAVVVLGLERAEGLLELCGARQRKGGQDVWRARTRKRSRGGDERRTVSLDVIVGEEG